MERWALAKCAAAANALYKAKNGLHETDPTQLL